MRLNKTPIGENYRVMSAKFFNYADGIPPEVVVKEAFAKDILSPTFLVKLLFPWEDDPMLLEPNGSNTISGYLQSRPFLTFSGHLLLSPVDSHQLLGTLVGVSFISLFVIS